jgi:DNA-binding protein YbaB
MSTTDINSYRLTSMEEPTDEMLSQIMKEAAEDAKQKAESAHKKFFDSLRKEIKNKEAVWSKQYNISFE